ncbi:MAG: tRNA epoxyqueuosine(34) reductase QueG [Bryobacteraceae bacterium]
MDAATAKALARDCGFELAGIAPAIPAPEAAYYHQWAAAGFAGEMRYLTDRRAAVRNDARNLLPSAQSVLCVGKLYNGPEPHSVSFREPELGWISRYAWGEDYHDVLRAGLERLVRLIREWTTEPFEYKICVDTAPLLERAYARHAGLGWIAKNTCLINERVGSWFFLGELLLSIPFATDSPQPDRCGTCTACIAACPTAAIVPTGLHSGPEWAIDSRACISYFTIELRGPVPEEHRTEIGNHIFGCDICQDVCPWNGRSPESVGPSFAPRHFAPPLEKLAAITAEEFANMFRGSPVKRARYSGFLRNVAIAIGNSRLEKFRRPLERLAGSDDPLVAEHARWGLGQLTASADPQSTAESPRSDAPTPAPDAPSPASSPTPRGGN